MEDGDGAVLYVPVPGWIGEIAMSGANAGATTGATTQDLGKTATTVTGGAAPKDKPPQQMVEVVSDLLNRFAHSVFIQNALRGRTINLSGKLRYDLAPGSQIQIEPSAQATSGDRLAVEMYGQVVRVSNTLDCEGKKAGTSFIISACRTEEENTDDRYTINTHPLYGTEIVPGGPLSVTLDMP